MNESEFETIEVEPKGRVAHLRLNAPERLNAMSLQMCREITAALDNLAQDHEIRCVLLSGNGRAFSSGYDLGESEDEIHGSMSARRAAVTNSDDFARRVWEFPKPIIAATHGYCLAGACEIAMLCDITISTRTCKFGEPEIRFGSGSTLVMPWVLPMKIVKELLLTGSYISGERAHEIGMVNRVTDDDSLIHEAEKMAALLALMPADAVQLTKRGINASYETMGMRSAIAYHSELVALLGWDESDEHKEFLRLASEQGVRQAVRSRDARFKEFEE